MDNLYGILKSAHSGWRYIVFVLLVVAVINALSGWLGKKTYTEGNRKLNVFTLISAHIQLLFGLVLYFISPLTKLPASEAIGRYWKMEHISMMILAIILITIGNSKSKKITDGVAKHKAIAIFFGLALVIIIGAIFMMVKADPSKTFFGVS
ncbi:cytochrome B [Pedobacter sp. LMG 31464]|uniref:Cytochrome B n=1 Tax=Pedobacter planticolens TaxID=2679964 RepID=A0A923E1Y8_9SPHI|nr:cytochrome B [Pedobacter planticolens]MBB2146079.1 cytochrome B [Pedobacter planticolens]